jgi:hypothetical protein
VNDVALYLGYQVDGHDDITSQQGARTQRQRDIQVRGCTTTYAMVPNLLSCVHDVSADVNTLMPLICCHNGSSPLNNASAVCSNRLLGLGQSQCPREPLILRGCFLRQVFDNSLNARTCGNG